MGAMRLVIVLVAATVAALTLALVVRNMSGSKPAHAVAAAIPAAPMVRVLVAKHDLAVGDRLKADDVAWQSWPQSGVNPAFVTGGLIDPKQNLAQKAEAALQAAGAGDPAVQNLTGALVREAMLANEPISARKVVKHGQGGVLAVKLPAGMRAMALPVTVDSGVAGFILPGDHVDVVQNVKMSGGSGDIRGPAQQVQTKVVMRNLTVLAIDQLVEPKSGSATIVGATATLRVPADQIDILAKAKEEGTLVLALRSYEDMGGPEGVTEPVQVARRGGVVHADPGPQIRVYRGNALSEVLTQ